MKSKSPTRQRKKSVLNRTIDFFINSKYRAFLVGGYVRDATLGIKPLDFDIVVEGDAIKAARQLNAKLKGKLFTYKEFGTASIVTDGKRIDLASARIEKYPSPARLPFVYPSTIIEDLNRRDFTINAMAMSISKGNFGEIIDPFSGLADIKSGFIRILHKNSFIDDPTRIFRALRYKNRFNFKIEKKTMARMKEAIEKKMISLLSGQRILNEIRLIFAEERYHETINDISDFRIFRVNKHSLELLPLLGVNSIYLYLSKIDSKDLPLRAEERKIVNDFRKLHAISSKASKAQKNSRLYRIFSSVAEEVVKNLPVMYPELASKVKLYFTLKKTKPYIRGSDLKRLKIRPQRTYNRLLKKMYDLQLDKQIRSRKEALRYLRSL